MVGLDSKSNDVERVMDYCSFGLRVWLVGVLARAGGSGMLVPVVVRSTGDLGVGGGASVTSKLSREVA